MSRFEHLDLASLRGIDIDSPLSSARALTSEYFRDGYAKAAKAARDLGNEPEALIYSFLQALVSIQLNFDTQERPFGPLWSGPEGRSLIPDDLDEKELGFVRALSEKAQEPALRARLCDILWVRKKDHEAGINAAEAYLVTASNLCATEHWVHAPPLFKRGIYLAGRFGKSKDLYKNAEKTLVEETRKSATSDSDYFCCKLLKLILHFGFGEPSEFCRISNEIANEALKTENYRKAETYFRIAADFQKKSDNYSEADAFLILAAEAKVSEAHKRVEQGNYFAAVSLLSPAIDALSKAGCEKDRVKELRGKLNAWQIESLKEFQSMDQGMDISNVVDEVTRSFTGLAFADAVRKLAFIRPLTDPKKAKQDVLERAKQAPLSSMFDGVIVDHRGRTTAHKKGLFDLKGEDLEKALEAEAFDNLSSINWPYIVQACINPARRQILNEHYPRLEDLEGLVVNNPFVPSGHEMIYLRGIHAGFHGDFLISSHLLAVQIENSIRHVLESRGVDISNLKSDLTQPVKLLGPLFDLPESKEVLGEALHFELRCLLIEKRGASFRNNIAHGFSGTGDCYSPAAIITWWITIRICFMVYHIPAKDESQESSDKKTEEE